MSWYHRLGFFAVITGLLFVGWWPVALFYVLWLVYYTIPYELIFLGFLLDGYFGVSTAYFWYTFLGLFFCLTAIYIKPLIYSQLFRGEVIS